jgi:hypothetical protein
MPSIATRPVMASRASAMRLKWRMVVIVTAERRQSMS